MLSSGEELRLTSTDDDDANDDDKVKNGSDVDGERKSKKKKKKEKKKKRKKDRKRKSESEDESDDDDRPGRLTTGDGGDDDVVLRSIEVFDDVWTVDTRELSVERRNFFKVFVSKYVIQMPS